MSEQPSSTAQPASGPTLICHYEPDEGRMLKALMIILSLPEPDPESEAKQSDD
jgi:hypothetical protein